ncbi:MAG: hypothetical protein LBK43_02520 [Treponema sp.]|jgi:hypothetical protein|nr:hypothetical protein [Treponema sp.]
MSRHGWRLFRQRFDDLRLKPILDYEVYRHITEEGGCYRFIGGFESTDGYTLWIRSENLTIPVNLAGAHTYLLPMTKGGVIPESFDPSEEIPERIRWNQVSSLAEGAKVFVGGNLVFQDERWTFVSTPEHPLLLIFYDGLDRALTIRTIRAGRNRNEYWNPLTPYAFILGAFSLLLIAAYFLPRPAFRLTGITAFILLFTPLFPLIPPGILCTVLYRRLWWRARIFRAYRDLARLPLKYLAPGTWECRLPDGESYRGVYYDALPVEAAENQIPLLIPEPEEHKTGWYIFGSLPEGTAPEVDALPREPRDPCAIFGAIPGNPEKLARGYTFKAYRYEIISCLFLGAGIGITLSFIGLLVFMLV